MGAHPAPENRIRVARWLVLFITFAAWLAAMVLVYRAHGPQPIDPEVLTNRQALDSIFAENAPKRSRWKVYFNVSALVTKAIEKNPELKKMFPEDWQERYKLEMAAAERDGATPGEIQVGIVTGSLKLRGEVRAEQRTFFNLAVPRELIPDAFRPLSEFSSESTEQITRDQGLEEFTVKVHAGMGPEAILRGAREGNELKIVVILYNAADGQKYNEQHLRIPIAGASKPQLARTPFMYRPGGMQEGDTWTVALLDLDNAMSLKFTAAKLRVAGRRAIRYHGGTVQAFEVEGELENTKVYAWYSADGHVLKQVVKFTEDMPLTWILEDDPGPEPPPPAPLLEPAGH